MEPMKTPPDLPRSMPAARKGKGTLKSFVNQSSMKELLATDMPVAVPRQLVLARRVTETERGGAGGLGGGGLEKVEGGGGSTEPVPRKSAAQVI